VLNITPDSFSDGGRFNDPDGAYARALEMEEQGVDIIDIGAESTKPGSRRITADEEWQRLVPVLKRLRGNLRVPLSLDTYKSEVAQRAFDYGVEIVNDPSGLTFDPQLARVAANGNAGLILNHMRGQPETWARLPPMQDPAGTIARELEATASRARRSGVDKARIVVDPGLGFGKRKEQNAEILASLGQFAALDYPVLVGPSRKSFLQQSSEEAKVFATAAAVTAAILNGAHIVRVHDIREMQAVVQVADEIARAAAAVRVIANAEPRTAPRPPRMPTGPQFEMERPKPPRPPIAKPPAEQPTASEPGPHEGSRPPVRGDFSPKRSFGRDDRGRPDRPRDDRRQRDFNRPERSGEKRPFRPKGGRPDKGHSGPPKRPFRKRP
jgi:dihydropteroate synthase